MSEDKLSDYEWAQRWQPRSVDSRATDGDLCELALALAEAVGEAGTSSPLGFVDEERDRA